MLRTKQGFTLIEMMLVMVIIGMILYASIGYYQQKTTAMRIDRTTAQMQQIQNAGLAYYVSQGKWPTDISDLQNGYYLPTGTLVNPWAQPYAILQGPTAANPPGTNQPPILYVYTSVTSATASGTAAANAQSIAGILPIAYTTSVAPAAGNLGSPAACSSSDMTCYVVSSINIPGQNLNNARAINFAGLYTHGGCVPVPQCPTDANNNIIMTPQIFVVPVSVSGSNDASSSNAYPITSFTAYATATTSTPGGPPTNTTPPLCKGSTAVYPSNNCAQNNIGNTATAYWRVCLQVVTEKGTVAGTGSGSSSWGKNAGLAAFTRCTVTQEPSGTGFNVFSN